MSAVVPLPITPPPGVVVTESKRVIEGRWTTPFDKTRFVRGRPQKIGGNLQQTTTAMSGTPRAVHAWRDFSQNQYVAAGTYRKLYAMDSSYVVTDITPIRSSGTLANNPFATVNTSTTITVTHTAHGAVAGDTVIYAGAATFNNVTMNGTFLVVTVVDVNSYTVTAVTTANATSSGGGAAVTYQYEINIGTEAGSFGQGWGVGGWGLGTWGSIHSSSVIAFEPRTWSQDHFGKLLVATYNGGSLWKFDPTQATPWPRAITLSADGLMPTDSRFMFITPERFIFVGRDQMVVQWCSQGDSSTWTPASNNTANSRTLQEGTKLVGGKVLGPQVSLIWTDAAVHIFQYTGDTFVYNSRLGGKDCGLISPNAAVTVDGIAYWMGADNFYAFNGSVVPIPDVESIRKYVFDALPVDSGYQCHAVYIAKYHEIWFFYPTTGDSNPTHYVIYHINDQCWSVGTYTRASGTHFTQGDTSPLMAGNDGYLYLHEQDNDDNGSALTCTYTLAPYALQEGRQNMQVDGIVWDFFQQAQDVSITLNTYDRLTDAAVLDTESDTVTTTTGLTDVRLSGRYIGFTITQSALGGYHRFGKPAAFIQPIGTRR